MSGGLLRWLAAHVTFIFLSVACGCATEVSGERTDSAVHRQTLEETFGRSGFVYWGKPIFSAGPCGTVDTDPQIPVTYTRVARPADFFERVQHFVLIRHQQSVENAQGRYQDAAHDANNFLTPAGRENARAEAIAILNELGGPAAVEAIFSGSLRRAFETAEIYGEVFGRDVVVLPELREYSSTAWAGKSKEELLTSETREAYLAWRSNPYRYQPPGSLSTREVLISIDTALAALSHSVRPQRVGIVIWHKGPLSWVVERYLGALRELPLAERSVAVGLTSPHFNIEIENGARFDLYLYEGRPVLPAVTGLDGPEYPAIVAPLEARAIETPVPAQ